MEIEDLLPSQPVVILEMPTPHNTSTNDKVATLEPEVRDRVYLASGYAGILENRDRNEAFNFFI